MAIDMECETDDRLTAGQAADILRECGFTAFETIPRGFCAWHAPSGIAARFQYDDTPRDVLAEGLVPPAWKRHAHLGLRLNTGRFDAGMAATMAFAAALASASPACFALSFQFETVYAVRDHAGLRISSDPASTTRTPVR